MEYKGLIFTNHVLQRMKERDLRYEDVYWIFSRPEEVKNGKAKGSKKYYRNWKGTRYAIVAKKNEEGKWVLLTCWWKELESEKCSAKQNYMGTGLGFWKRAWRMIVGK